MTNKWVDAVWDKSIVCNITSSDDMFDEYKCPIFYELEITTSGLEETDREKIVTLVITNGET